MKTVVIRVILFSFLIIKMHYKVQKEIKFTTKCGIWTKNLIYFHIVKFEQKISLPSILWNLNQISPYLPYCEIWTKISVPSILWNLNQKISLPSILWNLNRQTPYLPYSPGRVLHTSASMGYKQHSSIDTSWVGNWGTGLPGMLHQNSTKTQQIWRRRTPSQLSEKNSEQDAWNHLQTD